MSCKGVHHLPVLKLPSERKPHRPSQTVNRRSNLTPYRRPILTPLSDGF